MIMGIFQRKRRNNAYANATHRITRNLSTSSGWLTDLINGSLARSYDEYESGAGISGADAFQAQYNYKTMLEQMEFNRAMQEDAQSFNAEMQEDAQAFNAAEAEKQRFWEEQMYNQYQSPQAMASQYGQAGLNPALAMTGGAQGPTSMNGAAASAGSGATSGAASAASASVGDMGAGISNLPGGQMLLEMLGMFTDGIGSVSRIYDEYRDAHLKRSQQNYYDELRDNVAADTINKQIETQIRRVDLQYADIYKRLGISQSGAVIENLNAETQKHLQSIVESAKKCEVMDSQIRVNDSTVALNYAGVDEKEQSIVESMTRAALNNMTIQQIQQSMVLQRDLTASMISKNDAETQKALAEGRLVDAEGQKVIQFLEQGGVAEQIKGMKSSRRAAVANCVFGNICNVLNSVAGFMPTKFTSTTYTAPTTSRAERYNADGVMTGTTVYSTSGGSTVTSGIKGVTP